MLSRTINFFRHSFATVRAIHVNKINYKFSNITTEDSMVGRIRRPAAGYQPVTLPAAAGVRQQQNVCWEGVVRYRRQHAMWAMLSTRVVNIAILKVLQCYWQYFFGYCVHIANTF